MTLYVKLSYSHNMPNRNLSDQKDMLLTPSQAAAHLQISVRTLDRYQHNGLIAPIRLPGGFRRFSAAAVDALLVEDVQDER